MLKLTEKYEKLVLILTIFVILSKFINPSPVSTFLKEGRSEPGGDSSVNMKRAK